MELFRCSSRISSSSSDVLPLIIRVFCVVHMILERTMSSRCRFPVSWKGQYFQSGLGVVTIRDSLMTTKGTCVEQSKDYFLIDNRENQCYQCLLMISRHQNIIQYKESFCLIPDTLTRVCAQIHVETPLYTLVRDPALPVPCPFEEAYYFNYNDHQSGLCGQPISYAKPCVGHTKYLLHFKHCVESATWNGKDIDFECVATWKDGSESYLYVRLKASTVSLKDEQYRCLKYLSYGSEVYMSMSADATCRGLRSPNDGPFVLTLIRDEFGWPSAACLFPDWLKGITWKDLDGRRVYSFDEKGSVVQEFLRRKSSAKRQLQSESRCSKLIDNSREPETEVTVYSSTTHGCISKQQCLKFTQRADNVIELYQGVAVDQLPVAECHFGHNEKPALVLIPEYESVVTCPLTYGLFAFATNTAGGGCVYRLRSICANDTRQQQQILEPCDGNKDVFLECLCTWNDSGKTYVATRKPTSSFASICQERCTSSTSEMKPKISGTTTKDKEKQQSTIIDRALLSLVFHRLDNSDIFLNETTFNGSVQIPSSTSLKQPATTATTFEVFSTPTVAAPRSTAPRRDAPGGVGVPEEKIDSDSSVMIPRSDEEEEEEVPAPLIPRLTVVPSVENEEEEEDSLDDDEEDDFDVSGGSPRTDSEGSSDYERASTASSPSAVARGTRAPPPPLVQGQPPGQGKGGRLTNIYDSDRVSSFSSSSSSQSDTDFQFALIYNGGGGAGGAGGGGVSAETGLPRQRHQQPQKNLPTLYDYDENNHRAGQQHPGLASAAASASQSPYSPGNPQLSPDWASSQPRSSPNRSSSVQFFCLRRLSSRLGWTIVTLSSVVAVLFFTS